MALWQLTFRIFSVFLSRGLGFGCVAVLGEDLCSGVPKEVIDPRLVSGSVVLFGLVGVWDAFARLLYLFCCDMFKLDLNSERLMFRRLQVGHIHVVVSCPKRLYSSWEIPIQSLWIQKSHASH